MSEKYTLVLTSYNSIETIESVLEGVCNLVPPPDQVLIIDDASNDGSIDLIRLLIAGIQQFQMIVNKENQGQSYSRNLGVELSKNELVIFQDDDDVSLSQRSSEHLQAFKRGADFSYVSSKKTYPNGYVVLNTNSEYSSEPKHLKLIIQHLVIGKKTPLNLSIFAPSSTLAVRKKSFMLLGGFDINLRRLEDIDLICRALSLELKVSWSNKILVNRQHTPGDDKSPNKNLRGELEVINSMKGYFNRKDYYIATKMSKIRAHYFNRDYLNLLNNVFFLPLLILFAPRKFLSIAKRIRHDFRQGNQK